MLLTSWLARIVNSIPFKLSSILSRHAVRRRINCLRSPVISRIEGLEERCLLSAVGVSIDAANHQLMIFDPATGTQTGQVSIPSADGNSDTVISPDGSLAYVSTFFNGQVYVVDLHNKTLAAGTNPISVATQAEDLVITPDGKFLLVVDGSNVNPIVVIDTSTRATVSVLHENMGHSAVEVTAAGVVLVGSVNNSTTRRYQLNAAGQLTYTGQFLANGGMNVSAAPNGVTAVEVNGNSITSFTIDSMSAVSSVTLNEPLQNVAFSPDGAKLYVRTRTTVTAYNFDSTSGSIGSALFTAAGLAPSSLFFGTDQLDVTPDGARIYVSSGSQVVALDALSGVLVGSISQPNANFVGVDIVSAVTGPGTIAGIKFHDLDADGVRDANEPGLPDWIIYADLDNDKSRDVGEPYATTDENGAYTLPIESGAYTLREEHQSGWVQTSPGLGLYATGFGGSNLITLNPNTGTGTVIGSFGANVRTAYAGAFTSDGTFWTIMNSFDSLNARLATVNLTTGLATPVGTPNWNGAPVVALEADAAGNLYAGNFNGVFSSVNKTTGQLTAIGNLGFANITDLTFSTDGTLWGVASNRLYRINPATGTSTPGPSITGTDGATQGIMVDPITGVFYASTFSNSSRLYTINLATGAATPVGTGIGINSTNGGDFMPLSVNRGRFVSVIPGQTTADCNFGNILDQGTVAGTKFNDLDTDGVRDGNEPGLPGWTIYADLDNDSTRDVGEPFTVTDLNGDYSLTIASGGYTLREEPQSGWVQTSPQSGLFATGNNGTSLISINPATGTGTVVGPFGANTPTTYAGAFTPDGTFWTIINAFDPSLSRLARVNLATGAVTPVGTPNWSGSPIIALEADSTGNLYGASFGGVFYSVNQTNGQLTNLGNLGFNNIRDLTFDNSGKLWGVAGNRLYQINPASGTSLPGPMITGTNAETQGIMVDPITGVFYGLTYTGNSQFYTIDVSTGAATLVGSGLGISAPNGGDFMPLSVNRGVAVSVNIGQTTTGRNFGNILDQGTVTGTKFNDLDADGVRDGNEPGLPGWTIYADLDNDSTRDVGEPFAVTDSNGDYSLTIASGGYTVREEPQSGWFQTSPQSGLFATGNNGTSLISINPATGTGTVVGPFGANTPTTYAGAFTPDGTFWTIINAFDPSLSRLARVNLATGAVTPVGGTNWSGSPIIALEADSAGNLYGASFGGVFYSVNQANGQLTNVGNLGFNNIRDLTFDNSGKLWGVAGNRLYQINPLSGTSLPGPMITGTNAETQGIMVDPITGVFYGLTYTGNSQFYTIDVTTGAATLVGSGFGISAPNGGDFMPLSVNRGVAVSVNIAQTTSGHNFGNIVDQGTITGTKFNDIDGDGIRDGNELGLPGWTIYVDLNNDGLHDVDEPSATTDANGAYTLTVPSGTYTIREEAQAGWVQTSPAPGLFTTGNNAFSLISIDPTTGVGAVVGPSGLMVNEFGSETIFGGAITPDGTFWTIINSFDVASARLGKANIVTGAVTTVGTPNWSGAPIIALESDESGNLFGGDLNGGFYSINQVTGQLTLIGNLGFSGLKDLSFDNDGKLWGVSNNRLYEVNPLSGAAIPGPTITGTNAEVLGIMVSPLTGVLYASTYTSISTLYTIDLTTGAATPVGSGIGVSAPIGGDFVPLTANRGLTVSVNVNQTVASNDFGNQRLNLPPEITSSSVASIPENTTAVLQVTATDPDSPPQSITFSIAGGSDANKFTIDATTGALSFITAPDLESPTHAVGSAYTVIVKATDSGTPSRSSSQTVYVTVTDVNESPVIVSNPTASIAENSTTVLTVQAFDEDLPAQQLTFAIAGGSDAHHFVIDSVSGTLSFNTAPDFENPIDDDGDNVYHVTVQVTDNGSPSLNTTQAITVTVTDVPIVTVSLLKLTDGAEGPPTNGKLRVTQSAVSTSNTVVFYSIAGSANSGSDYAPLTGKVTIPAGQSSADIDITVLGDEVVEATETLVITLTNLGAHGPETELDSNSGNLIASVEIADDDTNELSISSPTIVEGDTGTKTITFVVTSPVTVQGGFTVGFDVTGLTATNTDYTLLTSEPLTFAGAAGETQSITVEVIGDITSELTETLSITLATVTAAAPAIASRITSGASGTGTILDDDAVTFTINDVATTEGSGTVQFILVADKPFDVDVTLTATFSTLTGTGAISGYVNTPQQVTFLAGQTSKVISVTLIDDDFVESNEVFLAALSASSSLTGRSVDLSDTGTVIITDDDTPTITSGATASVPENTLTSTVVLDVDVNDALIPGHSTVYSLSGPDAARFNINPATGQIKFNDMPNYEEPVDQGGDNGYQVTVTATADVVPSRSTSQSLTINVTPLNDLAPVFVNASPTYTIPENTAVGTSVGNVSATDGDLAPQTLTFSIVSGNSNGAFAINPATGQITVANSVPLNFETTPNFTLTVQVTDNGSPTAFTADAIVVINLSNVSEGPRITVPTSTGTYPLGSASVLITSDATFTYGDVANPNFNDAKLTVWISAGKANSDVLGISSLGTAPNQINIKKGKIYYGSTQIGTFTGGSGSSPNLVVTLNSSATTSAVEQLMRRLTLKTNGKVGTKRTVSLQLTNIAGANSNVGTREFTVVN